MNVSQVELTLPQLIKDLQNKLEDPTNITFLVGAGISMDPPASLPSARMLCKDLFDQLGPYPGLEDLASIKELRYEMVIERVQEYFDPDLHFLDYLDLMDLPNLNHLFLAGCILKGNIVITTNFDYLIEWGMKLILRGQNYEKVMPVITEQDFLSLKDEDFTDLSQKYYLFKIHGSMKNTFTDEDTKQSIITTVSALGKNRDNEETFSLESFKEPVVKKMLSKKTLIVLGYSGGDDFDVNPLLKTMPDLEHLIWLDHISDTEATIIPITKHTEKGVNPLLVDLKQKHEYNITLIKANTIEFVKNHLLQLFLPKLHDPLIQLWNKQLMIREGITKPTLREWLHRSWQVSEPALSMKFGASLFYDTGDYEKALNMSKTGNFAIRTRFQKGEVDQPTTELLLDIQHWFNNRLGLICMIEGLAADATYFFRQCQTNAEKENNQVHYAEATCNLALALLQLEERNQALDCLNSALEVDLKSGTITHASEVLEHIGAYHIDEQEFTLAKEKLGDGMQYANSSGNLEVKSRILTKQGIIALKENNLQQARTYTEEALSISQALGRLPLQYEAMIVLSQIYNSSNRIEEAKKLEKKSHSFYEKIGGFQLEGKRLFNLADSFFKSKKRDVGKQYLIRLFNEANVHEHIEYQIKSAKTLGYIFRNERDFENAQKYFNELVSLVAESGDKSLEMEATYQLGFIYDNLKNWEEAYEYYNNSLNLGKQMNHISTIVDCYQGMAMVKYNLGKDEEAYTLQEQAIELSHRLNDPMAIQKAQAKLAFYKRQPSSTFRQS
ncbi:MAG: SIR2 family protein [Candidatus Kariarchaeaceae archaeon]|jgi:tetratricopeptide (TPR) repeat protein